MQVKTSVTGYGGADKNQIQQMVVRLLGLAEVPKPDDAADALAIAICHAHSLKLKSIGMNQSRGHRKQKRLQP
jgi:crossover junction endodeoxyribonuclease RuvC